MFSLKCEVKIFLPALILTAPAGILFADIPINVLFLLLLFIEVNF